MEEITYQQYLDGVYPKEERNIVTKLELFNLTSQEPLELVGFCNLKELVLNKMEFTELNLSDCQKLEKITITDSNLTRLNFLDNLPYPNLLKELNITNSTFLSGDLFFLSRLKEINTTLKIDYVDNKEIFNEPENSLLLKIEALMSNYTYSEQQIRYEAERQIRFQQAKDILGSGDVASDLLNNVAYIALSLTSSEEWVKQSLFQKKAMSKRILEQIHQIRRLDKKKFYTDNYYIQAEEREIQSALVEIHKELNEVHAQIEIGTFYIH